MTEGQLNQIDRRLDRLEAQIRELREQQQGFSSDLSALNSFANELLDISLLQQRGLRIMQTENQRDRDLFQAEIRRIWEYLLSQSGNGQSG